MKALRGRRIGQDLVARYRYWRARAEAPADSPAAERFKRAAQAIVNTFTRHLGAGG